MALQEGRAGMSPALTCRVVSAVFGRDGCFYCIDMYWHLFVIMAQFVGRCVMV